MFKTQKAISIILVMLFILSTSVLPAFAMNFTSGLKDSSINSIGDLKNAKLIDKKDVIKIAEYHIESYLKEDIQTKGKDIIPSNDFINLYDLNDNLYAYIVPLNENGKNEIGYITIGAIEDGYDVYETLIDDNRLNEIRSLLSNKESSHKAAEVKLIYVPPFTYILKVGGKDAPKYLDISQEMKQTDITDIVLNNSSKYNKIYKTIRTAENKNHMQKLLKKFNDTSSPDTISVMAVNEDVRLVNEASFIPIYSGTTTYYGGDQAWYSTTDKQDTGCGPVAASNIACYLARKNSTKYGNLYSPSTISKTDFTTHMNSVWNYVTPGTLGLTSVSEFAAGVENFASARGVTLSRITSSASFTLDNTSNYIKNGLSIDSPVAILNLQPPTGYEYAWHWMTVTKYFKDGTTGNRYVAVSTWGERRSINYVTWFDSTDLWGGGLMYFN